MTLTSLYFRATEACAPCIATRLTALRVCKVTFPVIFLLAFRKHERSAALRTRDLKVWHRGFSTRVIEELHSLALRSAGVAFLSATGRGAKALFSLKRTPKSWRPDGFLGLSLLQQLSVYKFLLNFEGKSVGEDLHALLCLLHARHTPTAKNAAFYSAY